MNQIDKVLTTKNLDAAKLVKGEIVMNRGLGLARSGEFDVDNEAFKALRNNGYLGKLSDFIADYEDGMLSYNEEFSPEEIEIANKTSRAAGAVSANAVVPRYVRENVPKSHKILDFGAGKDAVHTQNLRGEGFNVTAHEFGSNQKPGLHMKSWLLV